MRLSAAAAFLVGMTSLAALAAKSSDTNEIPDHTAGQPAWSPAAQAVLDKARSIKTLTARMRQEKELLALAEVVKSDGTLAFARPRRLAIDLKGEGGTQLIIDGDVMTTVFRAVKRVERTPITKDPRARAITDHLFLLLEAEPAALAAVYTMRVIVEQPLTLGLTPRAEALGKILKHVTARFDSRGFVDRLVLTEHNGDVTRWEFEAPRINEPLSDTLFLPAL